VRALVALVAWAGLAHADGHKPAPDKFAARAAAVFDKAVAAEQANKWREAVQLYEQAFELSPHPNTIFNVASLYADHGEDKRALEAFQLYLDLAPTAQDRAAVDQRIAAILGKKATVPLETSREIDVAESYVLIDGDFLAKPGQAREAKLSVTYAPGHHWAAVVSPVSFGVRAFGSSSDYDDRAEPIHVQAEPRADGNLLVLLDYGIKGELEGKHIDDEGRRYQAPAGVHWLKLRDHDRECRPLRVDIPAGDATAVVFVMPADVSEHEEKRCRTLVVKQQKLVFKTR